MEEIEVLDLDNDIKNENKKEIKEEKNIKEEPSNNKDKKKEKKRLRKSEKIFLLINILVIFGIIAFYGYRTIHFYKLTHQEAENLTLRDKLTALTNIAYQNDGLYEKEGYFYYKGSMVNNYVSYSGRLFRIIDISDKGLRMIENDSSTNIVWAIDKDYKESIIKEWLDDYFKTLKDPDVYLVKNNWCNEKIDAKDYKCKETIEDYVGLLSTEDYLQAGGKNSYLNNDTYYWTINQDMDGKPLYVNKDGGINNIVNNNDSYYSYGIRPVITLSNEVSIISGDGSVNKPFIIENVGNAMLRENGVGSYVKYNNQDFRILKVEDDGILLIYDGVLEVERNFNDAIKYLNNDYLKDFKKEDLVKINYTIGEYNFGNKYNYKSENSKGSNYVTIPKIGDLFLNDYGDYWLNNISDKKLGLYYTIDDNKMFFGDLSGNKHKIRPIIKLNSEVVVTGGVGTSVDPLIVGDNDVEEN